jgi:hypothetical protein
MAREPTAFFFKVSNPFAEASNSFCCALNYFFYSSKVPVNFFPWSANSFIVASEISIESTMPSNSF